MERVGRSVGRVVTKKGDYGDDGDDDDDYNGIERRVDKTV